MASGLIASSGVTHARSSASAAGDGSPSIAAGLDTLEAAGKAAFDLITNFSQMTLPEKLVDDYSPGADAFTSVWEQIVDAAEEANDPGNFTAFIGFEWTSVPKGFNLHRNVILRDGGMHALQQVPPQPSPMIQPVP